MPTNCNIEFENNPNRIVYAGQLLRGTVRLTLTEEKNARGVYIRIKGKAYCHWSRGKNNTYTGREDYLNETTYFVGGRDADIQLAPGVYDYNFQCNLPSQLPTSVEGGYGFIAYTARVVVDIPLWPDMKFEQPFHVIRPLDVNADPSLQFPVVVEKNHMFFLGGILCCCLSKPIRITATAPVGGYSPGQTINLEIHANNRSSHSISDIIVQLKKKIEYSAKPDGIALFSSNQTRTERRFIARKEAHGCSANSDEIIRVNFEVPNIPPTDLTSSTVIKVSYYLRISASVGGCHRTPVLKLPITIGSNVIQNNADSSSQFTGNPPTYEEATYMAKRDVNQFKQ